MKVLFLDHSWTIRRLVEGVLEALAWDDTRIVGDALAAREAFDEGGWELLIVDRQTPGSLELVREVHDGYPRLPIVMLSPEPETERVREAESAGVTSYLVMPITPDLLSQRLSEAAKSVRAA